MWQTSFMRFCYEQITYSRATVFAYSFEPKRQIARDRPVSILELFSLGQVFPLDRPRQEATGGTTQGLKVFFRPEGNGSKPCALCSSQLRLGAVAPHPLTGSQTSGAFMTPIVDNQFQRELSFGALSIVRTPPERERIWVLAVGRYVPFGQSEGMPHPAIEAGMNEQSPVHGVTCEIVIKSSLRETISQPWRRETLCNPIDRCYGNGRCPCAILALA